MATLDGMYLFVKDESLDYTVTPATHPVERGVDITDHIHPQPKTLNLNGQIVGASAENTRGELVHRMNLGLTVKYAGRNIFTGAQIISFSTTSTNTVWGGYEFTMQLKEVRTAYPAYTNENDGRLLTGSLDDVGVQQITNVPLPRQRYHTVKRGQRLLDIARLYRQNGATESTIKALNSGKGSIFAAGKSGDWNNLAPGANLLIGKW